MKHSTYIFLSTVICSMGSLIASPLPVSAKTENPSPLSSSPVVAEKVFISQTFGGHHLGIDLAPRIKGEELEIRAAGDGTVMYAGICSQGWCKRHGGTVVIKHVDGRRTLYAHLKDIKITEGNHIQAGQAIGLMGQSGVATGPHLHFGICKTYCSSNNIKTKVNPSRYFSLNNGASQVIDTLK